MLVLDEPTAVLTPQESESLFATVRLLVARGTAVIFISHKLDEVMAVSHRVMVLRAGRCVAEAATAATNKAELARWMVGEAVAALDAAPLPRAPAGSDAPVRLSVTNLVARGARTRLDRVSLSIAAGEILGVAGVSGNGQALLAEVLAGVAAADAGETLVDGDPLPTNPRAVARLGVARVPEDRQSVGVVGDLPVWENLCAEALATPVLSRWGWVRRGVARAYAQSALKAFDVRGATLDRRTHALSGGNIQKLVLARVLQRADGQLPRVIVAHQPTWGLDVGAVAFVHGLLRTARDAGAAVLLISDDLDEIERLADRIAVMSHGHLGAARAAASWSREQLGLAMAGEPAEVPHAA